MPLRFTVPAVLLAALAVACADPYAPAPPRAGSRPTLGVVATDYQRLDLGTFAGEVGSSEAHDISDSGDVVGNSSTMASGAAYPVQHAFLIRRRSTVMTDLHSSALSLGGESYAYGVSPNGDYVVGTFYSPSRGQYRAFRWSAWEGMRDLGSLPVSPYGVVYRDYAARAVNDAGTVVGFAGHDWYPWYDDTQYPLHRAFIWTQQGGMRTFTPDADPNPAVTPWVHAEHAQDINATGRVAGYRPAPANSGCVWGAFTYNSTTWPYRLTYRCGPSPASNGEAHAINAAGDAVGTALAGGGISCRAGLEGDCGTAVLWSTDGTITNIGAGGARSAAFDVNSGRVVVGDILPGPSDAQEAFVWTPAAGLRFLPRAASGRAGANAVNAAGTIVGTVRDGELGTSHATLWRRVLVWGGPPIGGYP